MTIQKEVKVIISAADQYSSTFFGFNKNTMMAVAAVEALAAAMVGASIKAAQFAAKLGGDILKSAADFNDAMYNVEAVAQSFGTTGEQISVILDDMTAKFPLTGEQAGAALQLIAQLGYGTEEQLRGMSDAVNTLQIATGASLESAIMGTLAILNSFNLEAGEAGRIINMLAAAAFSSAASVEDLGTSLRYAAPIASLLGVSVEETVATLALLRDRGLEASQTGTTFRMALIQLGKETKDKTEILKKYGLTYDDVNPKIQGITGIIENFNGRLLDGGDAAVLFGTRSVAMANIINMGATAFSEYTKSITGTTSAYDAFEKKMQTWTVVQKQVAGDLDRLKNAIGKDLVQSILHAIGTSEDEGIRGLLNYLIEMENLSGTWGAALAEPIRVFKEALESIIGTGVGTEFENVYNSISKIAYLLSENMVLIEQWGLLFTEWAGSSVDELQDIQTWLTAINISFGLLVSPIALVHDAFAGIINSVHGLRFIIEAAYNGLGLLFADLIRNAGEIIAMVPGMGRYGDAIVQKAKEMGDVYSSNIKKAKEMFDTKEMHYWLDDLVVTIDGAQARINSLTGPDSASWVNKEAVSKGLGDAIDSLFSEYKVKVPELGVDIMNKFYSLLPDIELDRFLPKTEDVSDRVQDFSAALAGEEWFQLPDLSFDIGDMGLDGVKTSLDGIVDSWINTNEAMVYSDETLLAIQDKLGIVAEASKGASTELAKLTPPPVLIFDKVTGKAYSFAKSIEEAAEKTADLNKSLDKMTDREFTLYTKEFEAKLKETANHAKYIHEEIMQSTEWEAKIDIEEAKASAGILKAAFESIGQSVTATAESTASMFSDITSVLSGDVWVSSTTKSWMKKQVEDQLELQKSALADQSKLTQAQVKNLDARTDRIKNLSKEALITVNGDGLKPHLERIMWEIFEAIQIRATEEGLSQLLLGAE